MKRIIGFPVALGFVMGVCVSGWGQGVYEAWVARFNGVGNGDDEATAMTIDKSGFIYVTGYGWNGSSSDILTIQYFPKGDTAWVKSYNGPANGGDFATSLALDSKGNILVTGQSNGNITGYDLALIKYFPGGDTVWVRRYSDFYLPTAIAVDSEDNVYVTGMNELSNFLTVKYNSQGDTLWSWRYDGANNVDVAYDIAIDDSGNVLVTGGSYGGVETDWDFATIKYSNSGDTLWVRRYNGPASGSDRPFSLAVDNTGNVYVTGLSRGSGTDGDFVTIKYAPNGDTLWVRRYNGPANSGDAAHALAVDDSGNVYVTGPSVVEIGTDYDYATIKYAPNGDLLWARTYNGPGNLDDSPIGLAIDGNGNVYVTGYSWGSGTERDYATIKYTPNGDTLWVRRYNGLGNGRDFTNAVIVDGHRNVFVTGYSTGSGTGADYATIRYIQDETPILDSIGKSHVNESSLLQLGVHATDPELDSIMLTGQNLPANSFFADSGNGSGSLIFEPDTTQAGVYYVTFIASDGILADSQTVEITVTNCDGIPGDANVSGTLTLADIIGTVNYIFNKPGYPSCPANSAFCWLSGLLCRGDWGGGDGVSLSDVIQGVNYIFNKPGGPWNPIPSGPCCLPVP